MSDTLYKYENGQRLKYTAEEVEAFNARRGIVATETNQLNIMRQRQKRNTLLAASDWTQANDSPLAAEKKVEWATYRTALRDLPSNKSWPDVTFPTEPS